MVRSLVVATQKELTQIALYLKSRFLRQSETIVAKKNNKLDN